MKPTQHPKANAERLHDDRPFISEIPKFQKIIAKRGLVGLASNAKWNELITIMRDMQKSDWSPGFRYQLVTSCDVSSWDGEWWHHLPFPMVSVMWLDLDCIENIYTPRLLPKKTVNHVDRISEVLSQIGFDFDTSSEVIRIHAYGPKDYTDFPEIDFA
jgi:hypothetical protein